MIHILTRTIGNISVTPANKASSQFGQKTVSDDGNLFREELGPYRGNELAFYKADPVIFDQNSTAPHPGISILSGALTPDKGIGGTLLSGSHLNGKTRLVIYGNPKTGKPSSWTLLEWTGTGEYQHDTGSEKYEWRRIPNAKAALSKDKFYECYSAFKRSTHSKGKNQ